VLSEVVVVAVGVLVALPGLRWLRDNLLAHNRRSR